MREFTPSTTIDGVPDHITARIKKLLAQASKENNSQHEIDLCMKRAQELMAQWNIEQTQIEAAGDPTEEKRLKAEHTRSAMYKYQKTLWKTIAEVNFCLHWVLPVYKDIQVPSPYLIGKGWTPKEYEQCYGEPMPTETINKAVTKRHHIVGRQSNVKATMMMGDYLEAAINRVCPYTGPKTNSRDAISWKEGCAEQVSNRLLIRMWEMRERKKTEEEVAAAVGALIVLNDVYMTEYEKNIDMEFGEGTAARWKAEREEAKAEKKAQAERDEMIVDCPQAFSPAEYQAAVKRFAAKRREGESKNRRQTAEYSDRNMSAWFAGRRAGNDISLVPQTGSGKVEKQRQLR